MSNKKLLLYDLHSVLLEFSYEFFNNIIEEIGLPMAAQLQKSHFDFPAPDLLAAILPDEASPEGEILLLFVSGLYHGYADKGGTYLKFTDIQAWSVRQDTLLVKTQYSTHQINTANFNPFNIGLLLDSCRSEVCKIDCFRNAPETGRKRPPRKSENWLLKRNFKKQPPQNMYRKLATTEQEREVALRCLAGQQARGLVEINRILSQYHEVKN